MIKRVSVVAVCLLLLLTGCLPGRESSQVQPASAPQSSSRSAATRHPLPGRLLYIRDGQLWLHQGNNARAMQLEGTIEDPAWSADGRSIAYIQRHESFSDLHILDIESGRTTQVTFNGRSPAQLRTRDYVHHLFWALGPTWSPSGDEIIFLSQEQTSTTEGEQPPVYEYPLTLYRYQIKLIGTREPLNDDVLRVGQQNSDILSPTWSPDGRYLAYVETPRGTQPRRIMLYDFETNQPLPYPGVPEGAYDPAWAPDGQALAFTVPQGLSTDIWVTGGPQSNQPPRRLTTMGRARAPAWSPDGNSLAFLNVAETSTDLYLIELTEQGGAGEPIAITTGANIDATAGLSWVD
jgi:TolB protein